MNQVVFTWCDPVSAVPVLPATVMPGDLRGGARAARDDGLHHRVQLARACSGEIARPSASGFVLRDDRAVRRDDALDEVRLHDDAAVPDRGGDHRHLQRRDVQPLLPEREPAGVDLVVGSFGSKSLPFL